MIVTCSETEESVPGGRGTDPLGTDTSGAEHQGFANTMKPEMCFLPEVNDWALR